MFNGSDSAYYTVESADSTFRQYFFVGADTGSVYVQRPLVNQNLTKATATIKVCIRELDWTFYDGIEVLSCIWMRPHIYTDVFCSSLFQSCTTGSFSCSFETLTVFIVKGSAPRFLNTPYRKQLSLNQRVNSSVFRVSAVDDDLQGQLVLRYVIWFCVWYYCT